MSGDDFIKNYFGGEPFDWVDLPEMDARDAERESLRRSNGNGRALDDSGAYIAPEGEPEARGGGATQGSRAPTFKNIINPADWEGVPVPEQRWTVPGYFPHAQVCMMSGDGGQGKSKLVLQLAVARQMGSDWIGILPEPGKTLILSAEDDSDELHRRLDVVRKFYGASWSELGGAIRLVDLVGEDSVLAGLMKGRIEPTAMYFALDAYMADFKPSLVAIDVLADVFGGDELNRSQVRQFINLLKRLARKHDCTILLLAHPSVAGMNSGSGISGNTDWNNGFRARAYLKTPKTADGEEPDPDLRVFECVKNNRGNRDGKINLRWQDGVFVPVTVSGPAGLNKLAVEQKVDETFLSLVAKFQREGRNVSPNPGSTYAPTVFAREEDATGMKKEVLAKAMSRLLKSGKIKNEKFGSKSHERTRLVLSEENDNA